MFEVRGSDRLRVLVQEGTLYSELRLPWRAAQ